MIQSAKSLGASPLRLSTSLYLPLLKPGLVASAGLIFLEVMIRLRILVKFVERWSHIFILVLGKHSQLGI